MQAKRDPVAVGAGSGLTVGVMGPPRFEIAGRALEVDTRKALALLAYLAVTGDRHHRDGLADLLWPDFDRVHARGALRRTLSVLRTALGGRWLESDRSSVSLSLEGAAVDVHELRAAAAQADGHHGPEERLCPACAARLGVAVELYRGPLMEGFTLKDSAPYDEWQFVTSDEIARLAARSLDRLTDAASSRGTIGDAIDFARRRLALDPLHEAAHRQLMTLHWRNGDRAAAVRQYRECVRLLDEELGVAPLPETTALYEALHTRLPSTDLSTVTSPVLDVTPLPLVGRAAELDLMRAAYDAIEDDGVVVAIAGGAGTGKSRLIDEFQALLVDDEARVVGVAGYPEETDLAFATAIALLRRSLALVPDPGALLPDEVVREIARLVPEVAPGQSPPISLDVPGARARLFDAITDAVSVLASNGAAGLVVVDDLHWVDPSSRDVLIYLSRHLEGRRLLVVMAYRPTQVGDADPAQILRLPPASIVTLGNLDEGDVAELATAARPNAGGPLLRKLFEESEGLPLFVVHYLASIDETVAGEDEWAVPPGVADVLRTRITSAGEAARQVLTAAAVIGRPIDPDLLRDVSGRSDEETVTAIEELVARGLIAETEDGYQVAHNNLRVEALGSLSMARRRLLHRRASQSLRARGPTSPAVLALHLEASGDEAEAALLYKRAGDDAMALFANDEARDHYLTALALGYPAAADLHEALGDLETLAGRYGDAIDRYERAAAVQPDNSRVERKLGGVHMRLGSWELADAHLENALVTEDLSERSRTLADLALAAHQRGAAERAHAFASEALELAEGSNDLSALAQGRNLLGILSAAQGDHASARMHLERSLSFTEDFADPSARVAALNNLALSLVALGEVREAISMEELALDLSIHQGDVHRQAAIHNNLADMLRAAGRTDEALPHLTESAALLAEVGEPGAIHPEIWKVVEW